jgi:O-antigen/teichoic acid export membrane protein
MKREFTINIILLICINLLIKPAYIFGIEARIQNLVGIESYGLYFEYFNFVFLFQFINDPGIQNWNAQYVPKNRENIGYHLSGLVKVKSVLALLFIMSIWVTSYAMGYKDQLLLFVISINLILSTMFMYLRGTIAGLGFYRLDSILSILDKSLMILILGYLAWISAYQYHFEISALIYGQTAAYFIACCVGAWILRSKVRWKVQSFSWDYLIKVLRWSGPYVLILLFMTAYNKLDGVMLGRLLDDNNHQVGVYATAYRFYDAANMIGYLFAALLLPMFAAHADQKNILQELTDISFKYVFFSSLMIVLSLFFYGDVMLTLLYDQYEESFFNVLRILIISYMAVAVAYVFGTMLVAVGKVRLLNYVFGTGLLANILLNLFLIPSHMAVGAAIATLTTQVFVLIGQIFLVKKELGVVISKRELLRLSGFCISCIGVFVVINSVISGEWYLVLGISIFICVLLSFIFKIIDKQEVFALLRREK